MRRKNLVQFMVSLVVTVSLMLTVGGCAEAPTPAKPQKEGTTLLVSGGSMGGASQTQAACIASCAREALGIEATVIFYGCAAAPVGLHEGVMDISSCCVGDVGYDAYTGTGLFEGEGPIQELRSMLFVQDTPFQFLVPVDSDIRTFRDLIGKRVSPGLKHMMYPSLISALEAMGLSENDFEWEFLGHEEGAAALAAGKIDCCATSGDIPHPTFGQTDFTFPLRLVGFSEEDVAAILAVKPSYYPEMLEPEWYHMDEPILQMRRPNFAITTNELPEDIVYGIVKYWHEHPDFLGYYRSTLKELAVNKAEGYVGSVIAAPYHVGAYRYYKEIGWDVPAEMIPPEAK